MWLCCQNQTNAKLDSQKSSLQTSQRRFFWSCFDLQKGDCAILSLSILTFTSLPLTLCWIGSAGTFTSEGRSDRASLLADLHNHSIHCSLKNKMDLPPEKWQVLYHVESHVLTSFWGHIGLHLKIQGIQGFFGPFFGPRFPIVSWPYQWDSHVFSHQCPYITLKNGASQMVPPIDV